MKVMCTIKLKLKEKKMRLEFEPDPTKWKLKCGNISVQVHVTRLKTFLKMRAYENVISKYTQVVLVRSIILYSCKWIFIFFNPGQETYPKSQKRHELWLCLLKCVLGCVSALPLLAGLSLQPPPPIQWLTRNGTTQPQGSGHQTDPGRLLAHIFQRV